MRQAMSEAVCFNRSQRFAASGDKALAMPKWEMGHLRAVDSRAIQASGAFRDGVLTPLIVCSGCLGRTNRPVRVVTLIA